MEPVFHALANTHRRRILDLVRDNPGTTVKALCRHFDVSRIAVMKHLTVLEKADLIVSDKQGRERHLYFNIVPIQLIYERWTDEYSALWASHVTDLKRRVEKGKRTKTPATNPAKGNKP